MSNLSEEAMMDIVQKLIKNASVAVIESREDRKDDFKAGRSEAYYEMLDTIKGALSASGADMKKYGLDVNLAKEYI